MLELKLKYMGEDVVLQFEHSLQSLSKWEAKHKKAFMTATPKSGTEMIEYFQAMLISPEVDPDLVIMCSPEQLKELQDYLLDSQTAASVPREDKKKFNPEVMTSDLIYYWLSALRIPFTPTDTWHINRVMMLIEIASFKQQPEKKRSARAMWEDYKDINARNQEYFKKKQEGRE